jgi:transcriptional regulator with XRE-family HTH domain
MNEYVDNELYESSNNDIVVSLGARFRDLRIALCLTQKEVSEQSGVSVMTIVRFERGESTSIRLDNFIALMRCVQRLEYVAEIIPETQPLLYDNPLSKGRHRVKKTKR